MNNLNPHLYALIAGEHSGDLLGSGLMSAILKRDPKASFIGIGGPKMTALGLRSFVKMESLSVMGLSEVISRLPSILKIRHSVSKMILKSRPCALIGIDLPDFNLGVEYRAKKAGIAVVHYVSPSVWAWRAGRMKKIKKSCDVVLSLLPFEKDFYDRSDMPCIYVGHRLANAIPLGMDQKNCRDKIDLKHTSVEIPEGQVMGILPGSRVGIVAHMLPIYAQAARILKQNNRNLIFISTVQSYELAVMIKDLWLEVAPDLSLTIYVGRTQDVIASCDAVLLTCGTVALECMLLNTPFTVAYKVSAASALIARKMLKVDTYSLPNLIAGRHIVNEYIQDNCTPQALAKEMEQLLASDNKLMKKEFENIHQQLRCNSDERACDAVFDLVAKNFKQQGIVPEANEDSLKSEGTSDLKVNAGRHLDKKSLKNNLSRSSLNQDIEPSLSLPKRDEQEDGTFGNRR